MKKIVQIYSGLVEAGLESYTYNKEQTLVSGSICTPSASGEYGLPLAKGDGPQFMVYSYAGGATGEPSSALTGKTTFIMNKARIGTRHYDIAIPVVGMRLTGNTAGKLVEASEGDYVFGTIYEIGPADATGTVEICVAME
jgi:hypothetical protein